MRKTIFTVAILVAAALASSNALAHHSQAMFDRQKTLEIDGTLSKVEMIQPHSWISVTVPEAGGNVVWMAEGEGPPRGESTIKRFAVGDKVHLAVHPFKSGRPGGQFVKLVSADGKVEFTGR